MNLLPSDLRLLCKIIAVKQDGHNAFVGSAFALSANALHEAGLIECVDRKGEWYRPRCKLILIDNPGDSVPSNGH